MRLRPVTLVVTFALGLLAAPLPAEAQQAGKVYRIGWLRFSSRPPTGPNHVAFRQGLRELGYVEGQNVVEVLEETQREIVKGDAATMGRIDDKKSLLSGLRSRSGIE